MDDAKKRRFAQSELEEFGHTRFSLKNNKTPS
jgi:hypothetical protein